MKNSKHKIVLDFDDTIVKSSEQIIAMLNKKYNLHKTMDDLTDWNYGSIYSNITDQEVTDLYSSSEFFNQVKPNTGVINFLVEFRYDYQYVVCTKGSIQNLKRKKQFLTTFFSFLNIRDWEFIGLPITNDAEHNLNKSVVDLSDCLFCVDDNIEALLSMNAPKKILIKNYRDFSWNEVPVNREDVYVINDFNDLIEMCRFDMKLRNEGIYLG